MEWILSMKSDPTLNMATVIGLVWLIDWLFDWLFVWLFDWMIDWLIDITHRHYYFLNSSFLEASVIKLGGIKPEMSGVNLVEPMEVDPTPPAAEISPGEYRSSTCSVKLLKKDLVRIRLIGPKSTAVLKAVLKTPVKFSGSLEQDYWWKSYVAEDRLNVVMEEQCKIWTGMEAEPLATDVRGGSVLGLIVRDPRIFLPRRKVVLSGTEKVVHIIPGNKSWILPVELIDRWLYSSFFSWLILDRLIDYINCIIGNGIFDWLIDRLFGWLIDWLIDW